MADLRSGAVGSKRDSSNKAKWARGEAYGPGRAKTGHAAPVRPKPKFPRTTQELRLDRNTRLAARADLLFETSPPPKDHSSDASDLDSEPLDPDAAPDAEVTYSYDASRGPTQGSTVLSTALAQAVERFETQATEKLVRDEYEVLPTDPEGALSPAKKEKAGKRGAHELEEDDYEFV